MFNEIDLAPWCERWLGQRPIETLFRAGHLSRVDGLRLADGRAVVVKVRRSQPRLVGCHDVQQHLWRAGFPCPQPLTPPRPVGDGLVASAEVLMDPGEYLAPDALSYAALLAELIRLAPPPDAVASLRPAVPWLHWYHDEGAVWPWPDDRDVDLNALPEPAWLDGIGRAARARLAAFATAPHVRPVVGHGDFESQNLQWRDGRPWVVHDWDSAICEPEAIIVGQTAAMWTAGHGNIGATVQQTEAFLEAYQTIAGRSFTPDEVEAAWAIGLWVRAFNAKKWILDGLDCLHRDEAFIRARRAGITPP